LHHVVTFTLVDPSSYADLIAKARIEDQACEWSASCSYYVAAASVAETNARRAYALNNAAISSRQAGEIDKALGFLIQASDALRDESDLPTRAEMELVIGNTLVDAERLADAIPHLQTALEMFRRVSRDEESLHAEIGLGRALALQGRDHEAEQLFCQAVQQRLACSGIRPRRSGNARRHACATRTERPAPAAPC
jgi:tetratricopeptide (TPR) repeat protein